MSDLTYRPDVDGLRAIAVGLVVLFHGGLGVPGGFVGVDVFFVISGYLITGLVLKQQAAGNFTLGGFWKRRIRRIVPAATVVVLLTLMVGWFIQWPSELERLGLSALAQQAMLANVYFWRGTGYFDGTGEELPLLHCWSLAVEEQFYLIYPLVLVALARVRRALAGCALLVVAGISLAASEWGVHAHPNATFYLLPTRAWELLLGGLLWFVPSLPARRPQAANGLALLGLAAVLGSALMFDGFTPFPGVHALIPCIGTALIIHAGACTTTWVRRALSMRPVVGLGLVSYSLYLIHWPLLALTRSWTLAAPSVGTVILALFVSLLLACISWRFIERPFRRTRDGSSSRWMFGTLGGLVVATVSLAALFAVNSGFPARFPARATQFLDASNDVAHAHQVDLAAVREGRLPELGAPNAPVRCLLWGDSHAMSLAEGLAAACRTAGVRAVQATHSSTPPVLGMVVRNRWGLSEQGPDFARGVVDGAVARRLDVVFLVGMWSWYASLEGFESSVRATCQELDAAGVRPVIILEVPQHARHVPKALAREARWTDTPQGPALSVEAHRSHTRHAEELIRRAAGTVALVVDPAQYFLAKDGVFRSLVDGQVLYSDSGHLTTAGALRLEPMFASLLRELNVGHDTAKPLR